MIKYSDYIGQQVWMDFWTNDEDSMILVTLKEVIPAIESDDGIDILVAEYNNELLKISTDSILQFYPKEMFDDPSTEYYYVIFRYGKTSRSKEHIYMSYDHSIKPGDKILVWKDWLYVGNVIRTGFFTKATAPYPVEKTWLIEKRVYDRVNFEKYPESKDIITKENLYRDKYLNSTNNHRQFLAKADELYLDLKSYNTRFLTGRKIFTRDGIVSMIEYELEEYWCESNQLDVFYRTLWACVYMLDNNCFDTFYFDRYLCLSLIYKNGDFDEFLLLPEVEKPIIDKDVAYVDAYIEAKRQGYNGSNI